MQHDHSNPIDEVFSFGVWVGQRRNILRLTQQEVANLVGCSVALIRKIEADARRPSALVAQRLAQALQIPGQLIPTFVHVARTELAPDHLPTPAAAARTLPTMPLLPTPPVGNVPGQVSSFHGRMREIHDLQALLQQKDVRLITLTGAGGSGKTRLALQVADGCQSVYHDGVWLIDLTLIRDPEHVVTTIAQTLDIPEAPDRARREQLLHWLRTRTVLLLLDNCEHVLMGVTDLVAVLLRSVPRLTILATSRIPLRLLAEHEYVLTPLALPDPESLPALDHLHQYDAVAVFIARARAVRADFTLTHANANTVVQICHHLNGLPLAIELAAVRIRVYSADQLLNLLTSQGLLRFLTAGARDLAMRQQTMRATIDWSYHLLNPANQIFLARLGGFVGGWTLDAAQAICAEPSIESSEALAVLVEQNLIYTQETHGQQRYTMLETIREYALERLRERGEEPTFRLRHAHFFTNLAEEAEPNLRSGQQEYWLTQLDAEYSNLRATLSWCLQTPAAQLETKTLGLRLAAGLWYYWMIIGRYNEAKLWLEGPWSYDAALPAALQARSLARAAWLWTWRRASYEHMERLAQQSLERAGQADPQSRMEALAARADWVIDNPAQQIFVQQAIALALQNPDPWWLQRARMSLGRQYLFAEPVFAESIFQEIVSVAQQLADPHLLGDAMVHVGWAVRQQGDLPRAHAIQIETLTIARHQRCRHMDAFVYWQLAELAYEQQDYRQAILYQEGRLAAERSIDNATGVAATLLDLGWICYQVGELAQAAHAFNDVHEEMPDVPVMRLCALRGRARIAFEQGQFEQAVQHAYLALQREHTLRQELSLQSEDFRPWTPADQWAVFLLCDIALAHGHLPAAEQAVARLAAAATQFPNAIYAATYRTICAEITRQHGDLAAARKQFLEALELRQSHEARFSVAALRLQLGLLELEAGNQRQAQGHLHAALQFYQADQYVVRIPHALERLAACLVASSSPHASARLWGSAEALRQQMGTPMWPVDRRDYERRVAEARASVDPGVWAAAWAAGRALTWQQATAAALAWLA